MPDRPPRRWQLYGFEERFEEWLAAEQLAGYGDIELIVWIWIHDRARNPYAGVCREPDFIKESDSTIQCAMFGWHTGPFF